jgi:hypothetical protein
MYDKRVNQEFVMEKASPLRFVFLGPEDIPDNITQLAFYGEELLSLTLT